MSATAAANQPAVTSYPTGTTTVYLNYGLTGTSATDTGSADIFIPSAPHTAIASTPINYGLGSVQYVALSPTAGGTFPDGAYCTAMIDNGVDMPSVGNGTLPVPFVVGNATPQTCTQPTVARISRFSAHRQGARLVFKWHVAATAGLAGFNLYADAVRLNRSVIPARGRDYRATVRWAPGPYSVEPLSVSQEPAASKVDPNGFRHAAWIVVQDVAKIIGDSESSDRKLSSTDVSFFAVVFPDMIHDIAADHGWPDGWWPVQQMTGAILAQTAKALECTENSENGGGLCITPGDSTAQPTVNELWDTLKRIGTPGGKATAYTGTVNSYGWDDRDGRWFHTSRKWTVVYDYSCANLSGIGRHFNLSVRGGGNTLVKSIADEQQESGSGVAHLKRSGSFYLKVQSSCYWHFKVYS